jgi:hypothetical protein
MVVIQGTEGAGKETRERGPVRAEHMALATSRSQSTYAGWEDALRTSDRFLEFGR